MIPEIERLIILQTRDQAIADLESDLKRIPHEKKMASTRLSSSQKAVAEAKTALQENEVAIKNVELDIETRKTTIGRLKTQQFETRKNDEFRAIGTEIERYQGEIDEHETTELELMERSDELRSKLEAAKEVLAKAEASVAEDLAAYDTREKEERARLAEVQTQREKAASEVGDEDLLELYDRLRNARGTKVVVSLSESGQCGGCHVKVTPSTLIKVTADKEVVQCENCGRILFAG
ncbi:zinc ribbon domain-containing protein [Roseibacillus persicicus]|uniref:zinc ribbon domain-containing protein n=1 Tax=Roseibacillus persicicus TaxID=454148 RepID=UPI00280D9D7D|nr:C4-type zinc ribbon domain-containing protein [Roseibacillus persicicus]MDQ8191186.1 C4-type zinc ribbon domain-containing protein [Roseibacillus persicicus]